MNKQSLTGRLGQEFLGLSLHFIVNLKMERQGVGLVVKIEHISGKRRNENLYPFGKKLSSFFCMLKSINRDS